jgi:RimJ/RimL family protein N-acetyltransferase
VIPVLETPRLRLRGHRPDDFAACAAMWADPVVVRYFGGKPFSPEEVWSRLLRYAGHWAWLGYGYWAVEEKSTNSFIGEVGFADYKREVVPSLDGMPEIGWVFTSAAHGQGFATEAVAAALAWGGAQFGSAKTVCLINPENVASIRVATKSGYQEWRRSSYKGAPAILYTRD